MSNILLISVKPEFADKILNGIKTIELRKSMPNVVSGDIVLIYSTDPVKAIVGICEVKEIIKMEPQKLWKLHSSKIGIDKLRFDEYYYSIKTAIGIVFSSFIKLPQEIALHSIKETHPSFTPPQTFRYFQKRTVFKSYLNIAGNRKGS